MHNKFRPIQRINRTVVRADGSVDSFEKQLLNLSGGIFDVTKPLIVSHNSVSLNYFERNHNKPIVMRVNTALKIREKHEIGYAFVGQCLDMLKGSVLAFESLTHPNSMVVLLDSFDEDNNPYIAICRTDRRMNMVAVNEITSIYGKQNFEKFIIRTFDEDRKFFKNKKTEQYIKSQRLQLPKEMIYALSGNYYTTSFTKSQVENELKSKNFSTFNERSVPLDEKIAKASLERNNQEKKFNQPKSFEKPVL